MIAISIVSSRPGSDESIYMQPQEDVHYFSVCAHVIITNQLFLAERTHSLDDGGNL